MVGIAEGFFEGILDGFFDGLAEGLCDDSPPFRHEKCPFSLFVCLFVWGGLESVGWQYLLYALRSRKTQPVTDY